MARKQKKIIVADQPQVETVTEPPVIEAVQDLPFVLRRELEEIQKNTGWVIDYSLPIEELEKICNKANNPAGAWRERWHEAGSFMESAKGE